MLSRDEVRAWADIERRLVGEDEARPRLLRRLLASPTVQTVVPLLLAALFGLLDAPVPALSFLFMAPCGLVLHMAMMSPPYAMPGGRGESRHAA